ncbi:MAG: hypothetical protein FJ255_06755 [Phycisphaerae bacterium]|nr:hypothetical protein [Phycisphaerae bacterium]
MNRVRMTAALALALSAGAALGQEQTLQNDSLTHGGTAAIQMGFHDHEIGAARFIAPNGLFPLKLKRVQIFWKSWLGQSINNIQHSIIVYRHPLGQVTPTLVFESDPPQLADGFLNEFNFEGENIVFQTPTAFTVGLRFDEGQAPAVGGGIRGLNYASLVTDTNGCQPGFNPIFAIPGGWTDICAFGASGDIVIRVVVERYVPPCQADWNGDGVVDFNDFLAFLNDFNAGAARADLNADGVVDFNDFLAFMNLFNTGC